MHNFTEQLLDYFKEAEKYGYSNLIQERDIDKMVDNLLSPYLLQINNLETELYS
jgi:hypothetical protein